jgi:hypothetical protein
VLGHIAVGSEGSEQRYAAAWWTIDPDAMTATTAEVVALREDFPPGPAKLPCARRRGVPRVAGVPRRWPRPPVLAG